MIALLNWRVWAAIGLALTLALVGAGGYRAGKEHIQAQWDAEKVAQLSDAAQDEVENRRKESKRQTEVINAQNAQVKRTTVLQADAASSRAVVDGLRNDIRTATAELPSRTAAAAGAYATTSAELLAICAGNYQGMAATSDGHASDALMLQEAWPR